MSLSNSLRSPLISFHRRPSFFRYVQQLLPKTRRLKARQNHGLLVATDSIEATVHFYVTLEKTCQAQLMADASGKVIPIEPEQAAYTYGVLGSNLAGWFRGLPQFQVLEAQEGVSFES